MAFVVLGLVSGCKTPPVSSHHITEPLPDVQEASQQLLSINRFAFGGVGIVGATPRGELCYRAIASNTNRLAIFQAVLANGTAEAQLYALCGIRQYAADEFDTAAAPVKVANQQVTEFKGCVGRREYASDIIARIKDGSYDFYLRDNR